MITLRTKDRFPLFGGVTGGKVLLSESGKIADNLWRQIPSIYSSIVLHEHVIMPDHIHGLIEIKPGDENVKSITHILGYYKQQVTKNVKLLNDPDIPTVIWQRSFWGRSFWRFDELEAYEHYIRENPRKESK